MGWMMSALMGWIGKFFSIVLNVSGTRSFPPPLAKEEERALFRRAGAGDERARTRLIEHNLRLVAHMVRKYYASSRNQDELISVGTIGLIKAIDSYKTDAGTKFATYAAKCIQNEILMFFRWQRKQAGEVSINETIDVDRDGNPLTYVDIIATDDTIADDLYERIRTNDAITFIKKHLTPRERQIIVLRYGLGRESAITQREVAERLSISRSYVSRIEKSALAKIKTALK